MIYSRGEFCKRIRKIIRYRSDYGHIYLKNDDFNLIAMYKYPGVFIASVKNGYLIEHMTMKMYDCITIGNRSEIVKIFGKEYGYNKRVNLRNLSICPFRIRQIPYYQMNYNLIRRAINYNSGMIGFVQEEFITAELIEIVTATYASNIRFIPEHMITTAILEYAAVWAFEFIPEHLLTHDLILLALNANGNNISHVPKHMITKEMISAASSET